MLELGLWLIIVESFYEIFVLDFLPTFIFLLKTILLDLLFCYCVTVYASEHRFPWNWCVRDGCDLPCECWESNSNLGALQEQAVPLTTEPSLWAHLSRLTFHFLKSALQPTVSFIPLPIIIIYLVAV